MSSMLEIPPPKTTRRKKRFLPIVFFLLALAALPFWLYITAIQSNSSVLSLQLLAINSPITTQITEMLTQQGQAVQKGQVLARINLSGYEQNLGHAMALTRGTYGGAQTAHRVATAQGAEADTVNRIAMARHEENTQRMLVEQLSVDHAKALLHLRGMDASNTRAYRAAQQRELQYRQQLQGAKTAFELASRSRAAIEGELYKIRQERQRAGQSAPTYALGPTQGYTLPDAILAPEDGNIVGSLPVTGQVVEQNNLLFTMLPTSPRFYVQAQVPTPQAQKLASGSFNYIFTPNGHMLEGIVEDISASSPGNSTVTLSISGANLTLDEVWHIMQGDAQQQSPEQSNKTVPPTTTQAHVVFWPKDTLTTYLAPLLQPIMTFFAKL